MGEDISVDIEKFVLFHKGRVSLIKEFAEKKVHGRLIFQISFLGFESLAKVMYVKEESSKKRFIEFLSKTLERSEATNLYYLLRNSLIHQGFVDAPWNTLEMWDEYDISFLSYSEDKVRSSTEYPPESIIAMYKNLIDYFDNFFKKEGIHKVKIN